MKHIVLSRRSFLQALAAAGALGALSACGGAPASEPAASSAASASEAAPQPFLTEENYPRVDGSTACIPLMAQMMADTAGVDPEIAESAITVSTTAYAWEYMGYYEYSEDISPDLLVVYEAPEYVQQELAEAGAQLEQKAIGRDALVFLVNEANPVQSLTQQQLRDIYTGTITNWKDVGGEDAEIVAFQRSEDSGSQTLFKKLLMAGQTPAAAPTELAPTEMGALVDRIAEYSNSANAIGFSVYYYIDQMYRQPGVRLVAVDGVEPSAETIGSQTYPLCNEFYAVIRASAEADSPERQLYDWLSTDAGKVCVKKAGYVAAD